MKALVTQLQEQAEKIRLGKCASPDFRRLVKTIAQTECFSFFCNHFSLVVCLLIVQIQRAKWIVTVVQEFVSSV